MQNENGRTFRQLLTIMLGVLISAPMMLSAQGPGTENGQWAYLGGDAWHTRYTTADEITADNFEEMTLLWRFNAASFGPSTPRATPSYVDGKMITVTGDRRHVIALNPDNGEVIWTFTEPTTHRHDYSMRKAYGKGVGFAEVPGRGGVVFISTPGFFLHALDADTGKPLENWGEAIPLPGFPESGSVDLVADLIEGWGPWEDRNEEFDPDMGIPLEIGYITASSPPIVVNGTVIVNNSAEQGYLQTRVENVPGDILAYDAATGAMKWKFHVIPRPGEFGHDTWENDAWEWTGDVSSWAPMAADPELGLVYIVTNGVTIDYYGGHHPGDNLFSTSIIAIDTDTGERRWHYQFVHHDIWNYDTPTAPILMDVTVDGREIKGVFQATKQAFLYALDRETGDPIWPIEERPVPQSQVPGERLSPTQPIPTRPAPYDLQGRTTEHLIDYTPEIYERALQLAQDNNQLMAFFEPPRAQGDPRGPARVCPGDSGGTNITGPAVGDPVRGIVFVSSSSGCSGMNVSPGSTSSLDGPQQSGTTYTEFAAFRGNWPAAGAAPPAAGGGRGGRGGPSLDGLPIWKGPDGRIVAIDVNTGDHLWTIPNGDAPQAQQDLIRNHPLLQGLNVDESVYNRGRGGPAAMVVTPNLLIAGGMTADNSPSLFAIDKMTGARVGTIELPGLTRYGMSSWEHNGHQYVIIQLQDGLAAYGLPAAMPQAGDAH
ncbi:MAG: PQQ-binding-like beta-propeller repeat protein [Gemmatimonadota bacterium]|nr:PQQ-binding-like beta-propeller repeat protein [Gemmatimonadota bacterium]MDH3422401.1 PQQ-binding-like beta-propeller repeat protein [Gemmatimonadota bacterium]